MERINSEIIMKFDKMTIENARSANILELAGHSTELRRQAANGEHCGPCPKCGGTDRFYVNVGYFGCRGCCKKSYGAIDYTMWLHNVEFQAAIEILSGGQSQPAQKVVKPAPKIQEVHSDVGWDKKAHGVHESSMALLWGDNDDGRLAREYLESRHITQDSMIAFQLGCIHAWNRDSHSEELAIVLPWLERGGIRGLRYRFIAPKGKQKTSSLSGSQFGGALFGRHLVDYPEPGRRKLYLVEGELNAISIWQSVYGTDADALSVGSRGAGLTQAMQRLILRYRPVVIWLDDAEDTVKLASRIPGAMKLCSPDGQDANDLLQVGKLGELLDD